MHSVSLHHLAMPMKSSALHATRTTKIPLLRDDEPELIEVPRRLNDARAMSSMVDSKMAHTDIARIAGWPVETANDWKSDVSSDRGRTSTLAPGDARGDDLYTAPAPGLKLRLSASTLAHGGRIRGLSAQRAHPDATHGRREANGLSGARGKGTARAGAPAQNDHRTAQPIEYRLELPPNRSYLVASPSGGTGGAALSIRDSQGLVLPVCERIGLDNGTSKNVYRRSTNPGPGRRAADISHCRDRSGAARARFPSGRFFREGVGFFRGSLRLEHARLTSADAEPDRGTTRKAAGRTQRQRPTAQTAKWRRARDQRGSVCETHRSRALRSPGEPHPSVRGSSAGCEWY